MADELRTRVLEALQAEEQAVPIVVLARRLGVPPTRLVATLDDLFDEGAVTPGRERGTVTLVPAPHDDGRFHQPRPAPSRAPR